LSVAVAQNIFSNKIIQGVASSVPGVDPLEVINSGATSLQSKLSPAQATEVLRVFMAALRDAFIIPIALMGVAFILSLLLDGSMRRRGQLKAAGSAA
jgi:hypothetical protein